MHHPSREIIDCPRGRERLMSTFMSKNPNSCHKQTLHKSIDHPSEETQCRVRKLRNKVMGRKTVKSNQNEIAENITISLKSRSFETFRGNRFKDIVHGKIR